MRWESLFADMEAQLEAARSAEAAAEVAELTRAERATVELQARLRSARGREITVRIGTERVAGVVLDVAVQWVLIGADPGRWLVPVASIDAVQGLALHAASDPGVVDRRLSLGHALRAIARDRATVRVVLDGEDLVGRVERVGADHVDLAPGHVPARGAPLWAVPFRAIRAVRSA